MQITNRTKRAAWTFSASAALVIAAVSTANAQEQREIFHWSGRVNQGVELTISGSNLTTANLGPSEPGERRSSVVSSIPRQDGELIVEKAKGRGTVQVVRQPTAENGYTAVIRVRNPGPDEDDYQLNAFWRPAAAGEVGPPLRRDDREGASRVALHWSGDVDESLMITLRPGGVDYRTPSGGEPTGIHSSFNGMPEGTQTVAVTQQEGRGSVVVVQQPTPENGYTAMLRIRDPQPGYGHYSFDVTWQR